MNMVLTIVGLLATIAITVAVTSFVAKRTFNKQVSEYQSISEALKETSQNLSLTKSQLEEAKSQLSIIDSETKELQALKKNADQLETQLHDASDQLRQVSSSIETKTGELASLNEKLQKTMSKIDLYSRVDELVEYGQFDEPEYLYETSARFAEEIRRIREQQKELIKNNNAVTYPGSVTISGNEGHDKKILDGQIKLMLAAFNIDCDLLIGKVSPSNFPRTLERIEQLAATLERSAASLRCGFNLDYVALKYEECRLQYQFKLKKQKEEEEQRLIREQMREEQRAIKEYERAVTEAEKEERMYREMLQKARKELEQATADERLAAEQRIAELERQLADAEDKGQRAKSMAEQTRRGHVYIISNVGSFGNNVYKIGLTRRLEPLDRVKELGDASVPFPFDVHAMIYSEDAPALETALHREFARRRINAVNLRKEFFRVDLNTIKGAVEKLADGNVDFKMTALAEEFYETKRLQNTDMATGT